MSPPRAGIRYMGNKDALAGQIVAATSHLAPDAPLLDLFGGMCYVASAVASTGRAAWANDIQRFAVLAARCLLTSHRPPPRRAVAERLLAAAYRKNLNELKTRFAASLQAERHALRSETRHAYLEAAHRWRHVGNDADMAREASGLRGSPETFPYRLSTITFAWGYFGLEQAMQLDSLRYAIDQAAAEKTLTPEQARWCRLALLGAASRIASAPGHFAQYLRAENDRSFARVRIQRRRAAWDWCLGGLERLRPVGTPQGRRGNRVFHSDALLLWPQLDRLGLEQAVVYADPPYSKEHYSRYYHVLESLERYDYPASHGIGRYRDDRFITPFSVKTKVVQAMNELCGAIAARGWPLVLSYPSSGLLTKALGLSLEELLSPHFSDVALVLQQPCAHSTMGARHGDGHKMVEEYMWVAS